MAPIRTAPETQAGTRRIRSFRRALLEWEARNAREFPWRVKGLPPYNVLIAEVLLKRTTSTAAARVYDRMLEKFPSFESLASASVGDLEDALATIGLHRQRAAALVEIGRHVQLRWAGVLVPQLNELLTVPHLGAYSARAILSFAFDIPVAIVDSNVERVIGRAFQSSWPSKPRTEEVQNLADLMLPAESHRDFNLGLLDLGSMVCRYGTPRCAECPVVACCDYSNAAANLASAARCSQSLSSA